MFMYLTVTDRGSLMASWWYSCTLTEVVGLFTLFDVVCHYSGLHCIVSVSYRVAYLPI